MAIISRYIDLVPFVLVFKGFVNNVFKKHVIITQAKVYTDCPPGVVKSTHVGYARIFNSEMLLHIIIKMLEKN